jgi:hypothetical protein
VELWNESNTGLTLYIHPGRIKRGVALKDEMGPVFEPGRRYALVIDRGMRDAAGNPLAAPHRKVFQTVAADRAQPNIRAWEVKSPRARSLQPLEVRFGESLDYALLQRMLWVEKSTGPCGNEQTRRVSGKIQVDSNERRWRLTPEGPWEPGTYRLVTDSLLEDLAGNSLKKPFEVDIRTPKREVADTVSVAFNIDGK